MLHGYNPPQRFLPYLSWTEIAALPDKANTVIVLPAGATEQHGPHLRTGGHEDDHQIGAGKGLGGLIPLCAELREDEFGVGERLGAAQRNKADLGGGGGGGSVHKLRLSQVGPWRAWTAPLSA